MRRSKVISAWFLGLFLFLCGICAQSQEQQQGNPQRDQKQHDQKIVDSFYPEKLTEENDDKVDCFARLDFRTIVAAYTNGFSGDVFLLKDRGNDRYENAYQVSGLDLGGVLCKVTSVQLSDDRLEKGARHPVRQVMVGFAAMRMNLLVWAFDVREDKLINIGPTTDYHTDDGLVETDLSDYYLFNYYQGGTMQLITGWDYPTDGSAPEDGMKLYRLIDGKLQLDKNISPVYCDVIDSSFERSSHDQRGPKKFTFSKPTSLSGPFVLRVVNGDRYGEHRRKSAKVFLNGADVAFVGRNDKIVEVSVDLKDGVDENEIEVQSPDEEGGDLFLAVAQKTASSTATTIP